VNDNSRILDAHNLPFMGTVAWEGIMRAIAEIGYEGDLTYEVHGYTDHEPRGGAAER